MGKDGWSYWVTNDGDMNYGIVFAPEDPGKDRGQNTYPCRTLTAAKKLALEFIRDDIDELRTQAKEIKALRKESL
jgi:hypothetical protein